MSEHTPPPWELSAENPRLIMKDVPGMSDGFEQYCVAEAHYHGLLGHKESQINAAFIVKAVNHHDALVAHLRRLATRACDDAALGYLDGLDAVVGEVPK